MTTTAEAIAYGAATVVNAISTGKGAAVGVNLWTKARVELNRDAGQIAASVQGQPNESTDLIATVVRRLLRECGAIRKFGAQVQTASNIPIARGMKSSSVAANAVALATTAALGKRIRDREILEVAVESAVKAGVTITGAYDDACASYYGGLVVTDNRQRRILRRRVVGDYHVLFHVPPHRSYTANVDLGRFRKLLNVTETAHRLALDGHHWAALTLNGLAHSIVLGCRPEVAIEALAAGAIAAGLSGKGPATAAVVDEKFLSTVRSSMSRFGGQLIEAKLSNRKAGIVARDN